MQQNWGRRHDFVVLNRAELTRMLEPVFPSKHVLSAELLTAGNCNTNYKITIAGLDEAFVLRIYVRDTEASQRDYHIFKLVEKCVPVPEMLYVHQGSTSDDLTYTVMRWVDGTLLSDILAAGDVPTIAACAYAVGNILANIGTYTFACSGFFSPDLSIAQPFADGDETYLSIIEHSLFQGQTGKCLGPALTTRLWELVTNNTQYFAILDGVASLVHSDFKGFNILVRQEGGRWHVSAVLDWEFAFAGSPLFDIGNMLRYDRLHSPEFEAQFIRGYQEQGGHLPIAWKKTTKLVDLLSLCEFLNAPNPRGSLVEEVIGLIMGTLEHWDEI